ncbi:MAG: hypothetical protein ABIW76_08540 [Fibrobacteria bacterium]
MIRINLLKPLEPQALPLILEEPAGRNRNTFLILGGLALVAVIAIAVLQFPSLFGGMFAEKETLVVQDPAPPVPAPDEAQVQPKRVTAHAVEETVRDIQEDPAIRQMAPSYADMVASAKIEFQYYASNRILKDIKTITPPDIGFANFIFTPPGDFYIHGLAETDADLQRFKQGLEGLAGASIRPGMNVPAGAKGSAKEFSFFGSVKYPLSEIGSPPDHSILKAKLAAQLKQFKALATARGVRLQEPKLLSATQAGALKKRVYQVVAECSFQQMQDLINDLHEGKSDLGLIKFSLNAKGNEKVVAEMDISAYVGP